jgi:regulatory protein
VGVEVEKRQFAAMVVEAERQDAVHYVLGALSARSYTRKNAKDKLKEKGFSPDAVAYALEKMAYYGYIDDEAYCKDYIAECQATRSNRRIKQDLWNKGIDTQLIEKYLAENDETDACMRSLERKSRGQAMSEEWVNKLTRYLLGQGYEYDTVKRCIKAYESGEQD